MKLYLVRHTKVNAQEGMCYGQLDLDVAQSFQTEKEIIIENLKDIKAQRLFSSPLKRCSLLANTISNLNLIIEYDSRLKELNFGAWEGKMWSEIESTNEAKEWFKDFTRISCPNGESYSELLTRTRSFITDLQKDLTSKQVIIVCHSGIIRAFYTILNNINPIDSFNLKVDYGQIFEFDLTI